MDWRRGIVSLLAALLLAACATVRKDDLGHGFEKVIRRGEGADGLERYGYFAYLKYESRDLGPVGFVGVSPSGKFAIYAQDGKLLLYSVDSHMALDVTEGWFALPRIVEWQEDRTVATVHYYDDHLPTIVALGVQGDSK